MGANPGFLTLASLLGGLALGAAIAPYSSGRARAGATDEIRSQRNMIPAYVPLILGVMAVVFLTLYFVVPGSSTTSGVAHGGIDPDAWNSDPARASDLGLWLILVNLVGPGSVAFWLCLHMRAAKTEVVRRHRALALGVVVISDVFVMVAVMGKIFS